MTDSKIGNIKIVEVKELDDGGLTVVLDMDMETLQKFAELGLKVSLLEAAGLIRMEDEERDRA